MSAERDNTSFDAETWAVLPEYLENLPNPVQIRVWGDPQASIGEREAARLAKSLADGFQQIEMVLLPRRINYPYYPVFGVFGIDDEEMTDYGVRIIGLPAGLQMTSFIAAIQAVSFHAGTIEARTRIQLSKLQSDVTLELLSSADDESGTMISKTIFGLAVASEHVLSYLIMADVFHEIVWKYSARHLPHLVINGRVHADGYLAEEEILKQIARAIS